MNENARETQWRKVKQMQIKKSNRIGHYNILTAACGAPITDASCDVLGV
jgi:hypothetical protein